MNRGTLRGNAADTPGALSWSSPSALAWNSPWGLMGYTHVAAVTTASGAIIDGAAVTFTSVAGRNYRVVCSVGVVNQNALTSTATLRLKNTAGTQLSFSQDTMPANPSAAPLFTQILDVPGAGTTTYKSTLENGTNSATFSEVVTFVEDVGPAVGWDPNTLWTPQVPAVPWTPYTPVWSVGGAPANPNGNLTGRYSLLGKTCSFSMTFNIGASGFNGGVGPTTFSVPFVGTASVGEQMVLAKLWNATIGYNFFGYGTITGGDASKSITPLFPHSAQTGAVQMQQLNQNLGGGGAGIPNISSGTNYPLDANGNVIFSGTYEIA